MSKLFLLDSQNGMGLTLKSYGFLAGTVSPAMLLTGGVLAGWVVTRTGLDRMLMMMACAINLPDLVYLWMAFCREMPLWGVGICTGIEAFGYGFGFTGYMLVMVWFAAGSGKCKTSHYALMTVFMIAGYRIPAMFSGKIFEGFKALLDHAFIKTDLCALPYQVFFVWVMICTIPGFIVSRQMLKHMTPHYGMKDKLD